MSSLNIDTLLKLWATMLAPHNDVPPFASHKDMYEKIDSTPLGDVQWESFSVKYDGTLPDSDVPEWMTTNNEVWFHDPQKLIHNMLSNPNFMDEVDQDGNHQFQDFMSGNWAWEQCDLIAKNSYTHGTFSVPIILGSDKTTVSVATGKNEYYPLYLSIGNIHNNVHCAHHNGVVLLGLLAIAKIRNDNTKCCSLSQWLLRQAMYGLGPYIADYPEQVLLTSIMQGWCPKPENLEGLSILRQCEHMETLVEAFGLGTLWDDYGIVGNVIPFMDSFPCVDIYELLSLDILHQLIKGMFKDHLVTWVKEYLILHHRKVTANEILDDIDRCPIFWTLTLSTGARIQTVDWQ
ncbi:hypothetical protein BJV74DRAFT_880172 [Russula compacta]|nr:hypothetical protein BJV74DRAFT_880172 [Russula compacta]